jgi:ribosome-associated protein
MPKMAQPLPNMEQFELLKYEYVELYKLLKILNWVNSGGEAKQFIEEGKVSVNGEVETRKRKKLVIGDRVTYKEHSAAVIARR